jgi:hypothetical protein
MGKGKARRYSMKCGTKVPYKIKLPKKKKFCVRWAKKFIRKYIHECKKRHKKNHIEVNLCLSRGQSIADKWGKKCGQHLKYHPRMFKVTKQDLKTQRKKLDLAKDIANRISSFRHQRNKDQTILKGIKKKKSKETKKLNRAISSILHTNPNLLIRYKNKLPSILGLSAI